MKPTSHVFDVISARKGRLSLDETLSNSQEQKMAFAKKIVPQQEAKWREITVVLDGLYFYIIVVF